MTKTQARKRLLEAANKITRVAFAETKPHGSWQKPISLTRAVKMVDELEKAAKKLK